MMMIFLKTSIAPEETPGLNQINQAEKKKRGRKKGNFDPVYNPLYIFRLLADPAPWKCEKKIIKERVQPSIGGCDGKGFWYLYATK